MVAQLFDQINDVWRGNNITTGTKPNSVYMTTRFLSLDPAGFMAAVDCNRMARLPPWAGLPFLSMSTVNKVPPRNTYPKTVLKPKKLSDKKKEALRRVCVRFNVSEVHGHQIIHLLEQQGVVLEAS
jgi:hypothetical protein